MKLPQFGQAQNPDPYVIPQPGQDKKKTAFLMFGGLSIVLILLWLILSGGKSAGGQTEMLSAITQTGDSLAIIKDYSPKVKNSNTRNDLSLINIILSGNYNKLGALYKKTYNTKKTFLSSPKTKPVDMQKLDAAVKNDTIDSEILAVLKPKITASQRALISAKPNFSGAASTQTISSAQTDYQSISDILDKYLTVSD